VEPAAAPRVLFAATRDPGAISSDLLRAHPDVAIAESWSAPEDPDFAPVAAYYARIHLGPLERVVDQTDNERLARDFPDLIPTTSCRQYLAQYLDPSPSRQPSPSPASPPAVARQPRPRFGLT